MAEVEIPYPFWQGGWHNIVICRICDMSNYSAQVFGNKLRGLHLSTTMSTHLSEILRDCRVDVTDMICPKCGAKADATTGNKIINLMAGASSG